VEFVMLWSLVLLGFAAVLVWFLVIAVGFDDGEPALPYAPIAAMRAITGTWHADLPEPRDWYGFQTDHRTYSDVQMARIVSRRGIEDQDVGPLLSFRVRLTGGEVVAVSSVVTRWPDRTMPGALIPVGVRSGRHGDEWSVVEDLKPGRVHRLVLDHRLADDLIDESTHAVASTGRPQMVVVRRLAPTGRTRVGHIEVTIHFDTSGGLREMTGFLRPHEVAAVRFSGTASGYIDNKGRWALGPTWY